MSDSMETITAALRAAKAPDTTPDKQDKHERKAIDAWRQIALDTGLDEVLLDRALRDAPAVCGEQVSNDAATFAPLLTSRSAWALIALMFNDLRVGFFRTRGGEALIAAAKSIAEGRRSWLVENLKRQGVDSSKERETNVYQTVVGYAAVYQATADCDLRTALDFAVTEHGLAAAALNIPLNAETLRRRIDDGGKGRRKEDPLAGQYRRMHREAVKNGKEAAEEAAARIAASNATIRRITSP